MPASENNRTGARDATALRDADEPVECSSPPCYLQDIEAERMRSAESSVCIKRIYDARDPADGLRVLVDRLWPRGVLKAQAALDDWARELAPSTALRKWLHADPSRWNEFCLRYREELRRQEVALAALRQRSKGQRLTLLYAAKDRQRNHAAVLRDVLSAPR